MIEELIASVSAKLKITPQQAKGGKSAEIAGMIKGLLPA